jgi:hypothetical protein
MMQTRPAADLQIDEGTELCRPVLDGRYRSDHKSRLRSSRRARAKCGALFSRDRRSTVRKKEEGEEGAAELGHGQGRVQSCRMRV